MVNKTKLQQFVTYLEAQHESQFDMRVFYDERGQHPSPECGTAGCLGGWLATWVGLRTSTDMNRYREKVPCKGGTYSSLFMEQFDMSYDDANDIVMSLHVGGKENIIGLLRPYLEERT